MLELWYFWETGSVGERFLNYTKGLVVDIGEWGVFEVVIVVKLSWL